MDIALLTGWRGRGLGRELMEDAMQAARDSGRFVSLHVEQDNPARQLYLRLGFADIRDVSFYRLMHWHPDNASMESVR